MEHFFKNRQSTLSGQLYLIVSTLLVSMGLFFITTAILGWLLNLSLNLVMLLAGGISLIGFILIYYLNIRRQTDFKVTGQEVIFLKNGKELQKFSYESYLFSSYVEKQYVNGIYTGSHRYLVVFDGNEEKNYTCKLKKKDFDEFISLIQFYSAKPDVQEKGSVSNTASNKVFILNKNKIFEKVLKTWSFFFILIFLLVLCLYLFAVNQEEGKPLVWLMVFWPVLYVMFCSLEILRLKFSTPGKIEIDGNNIFFDGEAFNLDDISKITMTPYSYYMGKRFRKIKIWQRRNGDISYHLGFMVKKPGQKDSIFPEYQEFCLTLNKLFSHSPGRFMYDL